MSNGCGGQGCGEQIANVMKGKGAAPLVFLNVSGNDISSVRNEELCRRFREALGRTPDLLGVPLRCRILL